MGGSILFTSGTDNTVQSALALRINATNARKRADDLKASASASDAEKATAEAEAKKARAEADAAGRTAVAAITAELLPAGSDTGRKPIDPRTTFQKGRIAIRPR